MLVNRLSVLAAVVAVTACTQEIPDSGKGVGFGDYEQYQLERARQQSAQSTGGSPLIAPQAVSDEATTQAIPSSDLAAAGIGGGADLGAPLSAMGQQAAAPTPAPAATGVETNNPNLSDEQDFSAVTSRESIQSDAERLAAAAAAREVAPVTDLPDRPANTGPNIVVYALNAPNAKGQEWYSRSILSGQRRFERNCAGYNSPDAAQRDFLARGGPDRDPRGIDPDGDGFACGWDPAPFRLAAGN